MSFSIPHGWISEVDGAALDLLLATGEYLYVDRKQAEPAEGFAPTIAAFANSYGGWLLIGVEDKNGEDGQARIAEWRPTGKPIEDPQAWIANKVREVIDPAPTFVSAVVPWGDGDVLVVRVLESNVGPHFVLHRDKATGEPRADVFVRVHEQKSRLVFDRAVTSKTELLALVERGRHGERDARRRIDAPSETPLITAELLLPARTVRPSDVGYDAAGAPEFQAGPRRPSITIRCAPMSTLPWLPRRVLSAEGLEAARSAAGRVAAFMWPPYPEAAEIEPVPSVAIRQRGYAVRVRTSLPNHVVSDAWFGSTASISLVADAGGTFGVSVVLADEDARPLDARQRDILDLARLTHWVRHMLEGVAGLAADEYGVRGPCVLDLRASELDTVSLRGLDGDPAAAPLLAGSLQMEGQLTLPADKRALERLLQEWQAEWGRAAGIEMWP